MIDDMCSVEIDRAGRMRCEPPRVLKRRLPVIVFFRDRTIDMQRAIEFHIPLVYIRKGRTLTIKNAPHGKFTIVAGHLLQLGQIKILRAGESEADLKKSKELIRKKNLQEKP